MSESPAAQILPLAKTVQNLRAIPLEDKSDTNVPPAARPLLTQLKHQLRDLVLDTLNSQPHRFADPGPLRSAILTNLKQSGITVADPSVSEAYGSITDISIQRSAKYKDLMALTIKLGIVCGEDTSFYILKYRRNRWALALALEANNYTQINGAREAFQYAISPPNRRNELFIVTVAINPWCTSCWQSIHYKVLRIGPQAYRPRILMSRTTLVYRCDEARIRLLATTNGFTLRYVGRGNRLQIEKYAVNGAKVTRVP